MLHGDEAWHFTTTLYGEEDALCRTKIDGKTVLMGEYPGIQGLDVFEGDAYIFTVSVKEMYLRILQISPDGEILHIWELPADPPGKEISAGCPMDGPFDDTWLRDIAVTPDYIFCTDHRWDTGPDTAFIETYIQGMELNKETGQRRSLPDSHMNSSCDLTWSSSGNEVIVPFLLRPQQRRPDQLLPIH